MALIAKRKNSSQPHHRASDQQMHAALSLHSSSKACHGMPRASDWARRRRVARSSVAGDKATGAGAAGDGTMGGPGGRPLTPPLAKAEASKWPVVLWRLHRLVEEVSPSRAFFTATITGEPRFGFGADLAGASLAKTGFY